MRKSYPNIERLYDRELNLEVQIDYNEFDTWTVDMIGNDGEPDCCIGHFGKNMFFRTNAGMKRKKYKTFTRLINAIKKSAQKNGLEVTGWKVIERC